MTSPVLITGGAGSVGRQLITRLRDAGRPVRVFDLPFMDFSGLEDDNGIDIVKGDITNADDVSKGVEGVSAVVHLAALLPPNSERDRERTFAVNVGGTESIVKALEAISPDATLVFTSSISTYGDTSAETPPVRTNQPSAGYRHIRRQQDSGRGPGDGVVIENRSTTHCGHRSSRVP